MGQRVESPAAAACDEPSSEDVFDSQCRFEDDFQSDFQFVLSGMSLDTLSLITTFFSSPSTICSLLLTNSAVYDFLSFDTRNDGCTHIKFVPKCLPSSAGEDNLRAYVRHLSLTCPLHLSGGDVEDYVDEGAEDGANEMWNPHGGRWKRGQRADAKRERKKRLARKKRRNRIHRLRSAGVVLKLVDDYGEDDGENQEEEVENVDPPPPPPPSSNDDDEYCPTATFLHSKILASTFGHLDHLSIDYRPNCRCCRRAHYRSGSVFLKLLSLSQEAFFRNLSVLCLQNRGDIDVYGGLPKKNPPPPQVMALSALRTIQKRFGQLRKLVVHAGGWRLDDTEEEEEEAGVGGEDGNQNLTELELSCAFDSSGTSFCDSVMREYLVGLVRTLPQLQSLKLSQYEKWRPRYEYGQTQWGSGGILNPRIHFEDTHDASLTETLGAPFGRSLRRLQKVEFAKCKVPISLAFLALSDRIESLKICDSVDLRGNLEERLTHGGVTNIGLSSLRSLEIVKQKKVTCRGLVAIFRRFTNLRKFAARQCDFGEEEDSLNLLPTALSMEFLDLSLNPELKSSPSVPLFLAACPNLRVADFSIVDKNVLASRRSILREVVFEAGADPICPGLVKLDLSGRRFRQWNSVVRMCKLFPGLRGLSFSIAGAEFPSELSHAHDSRHMSLSTVTIRHSHLLLRHFAAFARTLPNLHGFRIDPIPTSFFAFSMVRSLPEPGKRLLDFDNHALVVVKLSNVPLGFAGFLQVRESFPHILGLYVSSCNITFDFNLSDGPSILSTHSTLKRLDISLNRIKQGEVLAVLLQTHPSLEILNCNDCHLVWSDECTRALGSGTTKIPHLETLHLDHNSNFKIEFIRVVLMRCPSIVLLSLNSSSSYEIFGKVVEVAREDIRKLKTEVFGPRANEVRVVFQY